MRYMLVIMHDYRHKGCSQQHADNRVMPIAHELHAVMDTQSSKQTDIECTQDSWLAKLGPGLVTGAADDAPSGIATVLMIGAVAVMLYGFAA